MASKPASTARIWLIPLFLLAGACALVFGMSYWVDALRSPDPRHVLSLVFAPNPSAAANTLANAGEIVAAVLAIALTVVAIIVELASNRYTHRVTELFVSEPINFAVMGLFVVTALQGMWVTMTFDTDATHVGFVPYVGIGVTMFLLTLCLLILLPYFNFVFAYLNPIQIVARISRHTFDVIAKPSAESKVAERQHETIRGIEQLADVSLNAMEHRDKAVSMASVNALKQLITDYQALRPQLPESWFRVGEGVAENPDFVSMDPQTLGQLSSRRIWFEMKILRQYQMVYGEALNRMRDVNYVIAINTRLLAEDAAARGHMELLHLAIKFFNTYLRAAINQRDVRTAYNVLNQYRLLAQALLQFEGGRYCLEIARHFKYYGLLSYNANQAFLLESAAYDLCTLCEFAFDKKAANTDELLGIFLLVDKASEGGEHEASLRGVRKAQVKLATHYLVNDDRDRARRVYEDMQNEDPARLVSIRDELLGVQSWEYWEITDRGANFDYLPADRKERLAEFFGWFGDRMPVAAAMGGKAG